MRIYHLVDPAVWDAACAAGEYRPPSFDDEGFVHCSFAEQVSRVANDRFADREALVAVELESDDLAVPVRVEAADGGERFPHVYGVVRTAAQAGCVQLRRDAQGDWAFEAPQR